LCANQDNYYFHFLFDVYGLQLSDKHATKCTEKCCNVAAV